jgi:macrocin-O-methyltransferase TylF-like protien
MLKSVIQNTIKLSGYKLVRRNAYDEDGLNTYHNCDFIKDARFSNAYQRGLRGTPDQLGHHGTWRAYLATWAAQTALRRGGDFIECGVYLGFVSSVVMTYIDWNAAAHGRRFLLIDSYEGISKDLLSTEELAAGRDTQFGSDYTDTYRRTASNLAEFKNAELIKGFVPDVLPQAQTDRVAYLHIDMNSAAPEVAALEHFWNRLVPGAVVLLDDYAYFGYASQKHAMDKLGTKLGFEVASLPTGQGLIIK